MNTKIKLMKRLLLFWINFKCARNVHGIVRSTDIPTLQTPVLSFIKKLKSHLNVGLQCLGDFYF